MVQIYGRKKSMEGNRMNQFDNYELTTIDYTLKYYLEHNQNLDDEDIEWCKLVREKVDSIIVSQAKYDMECVVRTVKLLSHHIVIW